LNLILAKAAVEALIFAASEPLDSKTIAAIVEIDDHTVKQIIVDLIDEYRRSKKGVQIMEAADGFQFCTHPECAPFIEKLQKVPRNVGLSQAAIETLAIVAYKQPITKAEMESLRGVSIESPVSTLLEKGLIEEAGRRETPGRPILYRTSPKFLKYFGLNSLNELPRILDWVGSEDAQTAVETTEGNDDAGTVTKGF